MLIIVVCRILLLYLYFHYFLSWTHTLSCKEALYLLKVVLGELVSDSQQLSA